MKQRISVEQLQELTPEQQEKLREWWEPQDYDVVWNGDIEYCAEVDEEYGVYMIHDGEGLCPPVSKGELLPLLSIGQCIELLIEKGLPEGFTPADGFYMRLTEDTLDALWQAVKAVL